MGSTPSIVAWCNVLTATTMYSSESKVGGASSPDLKVGASAPQEGEFVDERVVVFGRVPPLISGDLPIASPEPDQPASLRRRKRSCDHDTLGCVAPAPGPIAQH